MSDHTVSYSIRYNTPSVQQQTEAAVMYLAQEIFAENANVPEHADRLRWAQWAVISSSVAGMQFGWSVAFDKQVDAAVKEDPSGATVQDADVQKAVEKAFPHVLAAFIANPPPGTPAAII